MGRHKPGKPRRPRVPRQYTLQELQPPGEGYEEWFQVRPGMNAEQIDDPRVTDEALALMRRLADLGPLYEHRVPKAALYLDDLIDSGRLPIFGAGDEGTVVPIEEMVRLFGGRPEGEVRESIHNLHASGALLVFTDDEHDVSYVRVVAKRPDEPGQPWRFQGDPEAVTATTCIPSHIWEDLPIDVAAAVAFMRTCRSRLEEPDPEVYGRHKGVNGPEHAKKLFAAALASGFVDEKGCEACPTGHLCTRTETE
jgi:hypothetical protein